MKKILAILLATAALALGASESRAQLSPTALQSEVQTNFPDCSNGCITPAILRQMLSDLIVSNYNIVVPPTGLVLPPPTLLTLGGVFLIAPVSHQWINSINSLGQAILSQPAFSDISGSLPNSQLATMNAGTLKANITGGAATPTDSTLTAILDSSIGSTQGSIMYRNTTTWVPLLPGINGQALTSGGGGANPTWTTLPGTGTVTSITCSGGLTGGTITTIGTCALQTPVAATNGGTAQTTYATGDTLYASAANTLSKLGIGSTGQFLNVSGGTPAWTSVLGTLTNIQNFTASGIYTPTTGTNRAIEIITGGGGCGGGSNVAGNSAGGGSAGATNINFDNAPSVTTITIAAACAGGITGGAGGAGGTASFGSITASGGLGGLGLSSNTNAGVAGGNTFAGGLIHLGGGAATGGFGAASVGGLGGASFWGGGGAQGGSATGGNGLACGVGAGGAGGNGFAGGVAGSGCVVILEFK